MYSDKKNLLQLVALLKAYNISHIVLSPGSRNSPLIHSLASDPFFCCYTVTDERSAGFFAIGIIQATQQPVAVCCTSGTAVLNLGSAVAESFYQELPLIVITADRPASWIGQMDGQTIPQTGIFNSLVKKSVLLPEIQTQDDEWYCNRLINEALLTLNHHGNGPVHINIPFSEPLFQYTIKELPKVRKINRNSGNRLQDTASYFSRFQSFNRPLILLGQLPPSPELKNSIEKIASEFNCIILSEHLSNIHSETVIHNFDAILYTLKKEEWINLQPDLLITVGGHVVSKRIRQLLRNNPPKEHWHISEKGEVIDTFQSLTEIIESNPLNFFTKFSTHIYNVNKKENKWIQQWKSLAFNLSVPTIPFSSLYVVKAFLNLLPENVHLHLANSSSIRYAQLFPLKESISVHCNRGTNGIDGSLSSAVGYAAVKNELTFLLTGDLSFFYDMNGLWNSHVNNNLRILLNNNGGGEIFYALPGLNRSEALNKHMAAAHQTNAKGWADTLGIKYLSASSEKELQENLPLFISREQNQPIILEVFTSMERNTNILREYYHQLKTK